MTECIYNNDEICTNDQCPMFGARCPVPDDGGVCRYEEREEVAYQLTPKGCLRCALINVGVSMDEDIFELVWADFAETMKLQGYVEEEE